MKSIKYSVETALFVFVSCASIFKGSKQLTYSLISGLSFAVIWGNSSVYLFDPYSVIAKKCDRS